MSKEKILTILRHAKTEAGSSTQDDKARRLIPKGIEAVERMGSYLLKQDFFPQKVLCSTAVRTTETLMKLEEVYKRPFPVEYVEALYLASAGEVQSVIAAQPDDITHLMLIGHNPGLHQLCAKLAVRGDEARLDRMALKLPTCAFAEIQFKDMNWAQIRQTPGTLKQFMTPKMLEENSD